MYLKSLCRMVVPATVTIVVGFSLESGFQLLPLCLCAIFFCLFLIRSFTSDVGLYSLIAVFITLFLSIFYSRQSICIPDVVDEKEKQLNEKKSKLILNRDKKKRKEKKKRGRPMEEDKENLNVTSDKSKIYQTLPHFSDLKMNPDKIYECMLDFILSADQLKSNRFPVPGLQGGEEFSKAGLIQRKCGRCNKFFNVSLNGYFEKLEVCEYHQKKMKFVNGEHTYECCNTPSGSAGCQTFGSHIFAKPILHNAVFKNVREKRQVRQEQKNQVYALDCEMVYTIFGLQVAKIGIVNLEGLTIYESYVLPENEIIDYNTTYSGITSKHLKGVTTTLRDVQTYLDQLLNQDTILIGHGLESDLNTLRLIHTKVIDTSVLFPRPNGSKQKLKELAWTYLKQSIQDNPHGHDCIEDARTCMSLILLKIKEQSKCKENRLLKPENPQPTYKFTTPIKDNHNILINTYNNSVENYYVDYYHRPNTMWVNCNVQLGYC